MAGSPLGGGNAWLWGNSELSDLTVRVIVEQPDPPLEGEARKGQCERQGITLFTACLCSKGQGQA